MSAIPSRLAYSYIRFSSLEQAKGDSLRRQTALSEEYAENHGLQLDRSLSIRDLGVSAFRGKNRSTGGLAAFIRAVETGRVRRGSVLGEKPMYAVGFCNRSGLLPPIPSLWLDCSGRLPVNLVNIAVAVRTLVNSHDVPCLFRSYRMNGARGFGGVLVSETK